MVKKARQSKLGMAWRISFIRTVRSRWLKPRRTGCWQAALYQVRAKLFLPRLNNTFSWMLGGNRQDYSALWSALLQSSA
jgi:hypothetical protein